jgi:hypothetical protein
MSYVQVPPDSTGKKVYTKQQTVGADTVQTQVVHLADSTTPENLQAIDNKGAASVRFAEGQPILAGFGSLKTAHERAIGVYESSLDTYDTLFSVETTNGGAMTYTAVESSEVLSVTGATGSSAKATTNRYHYYLPGSANVIKMTVACGDTGKSGNVRRWGAFDDADGVYFELFDSTLNVVIRNSTSGSIVETKVAQSVWNGDKLNGTGKSGINIDITKIQVWWLDYQWLGAGRVRFGIFAPDGTRIVCHEFRNAGSLALPYMRTGTLPIRVENTNLGTTGSTSELRAVCLAAYTEGTYQDYTFWRYADIDKASTAVTTDTVMCSLRAKPLVNLKHNSVIIYPETLNVYCDQPVAITIWQDTTVTGGTWDSLASTGDVNYTGSVNTSLAQKFKTLYFSAGAHTVCIDQYFEKNDEGIQTLADGGYEAWSVLATKLSGATTNCSINIGYKELW